MLTEFNAGSAFDCARSSWPPRTRFSMAKSFPPCALQSLSDSKSCDELVPKLWELAMLQRPRPAS